MNISKIVDELNKGRTPNPDVMCNTEIKFKAFFMVIFYLQLKDVNLYYFKYEN